MFNFGIITVSATLDSLYHVNWKLWKVILDNAWGEYDSDKQQWLSLVKY